MVGRSGTGRVTRPDRDATVSWSEATRDGTGVPSGREGPLLHIYTDGAAGPTNPGPAASAWMIMDPASGEVLVEDAAYIGRRTNNVVEYTAIVRALEDCLVRSKGKVRVHSDSKLCINQINGSWRVKKPHLRPVLAEVHRLRAGFEDVRFLWVPRGNVWISECDRRANEVLDGQRDRGGL